MPKYADIVFPTAVRRLFTYEIPENLGEVELGVRVWVPIRNYNAIGVVVKVHEEVPDFEVKPIRKVLDVTPIVSQEFLKLSHWVHQFYFSSWGEVIQAALPAGLNFTSQKYLKQREEIDISSFSKEEQEILTEVSVQENLGYEEAKKRWKGTALNKILNKLIKNASLEIWEEPNLKVSLKTEREWNWVESKNQNSASDFLDGLDKELNKWQKALRVFTEISLPKRQSELKLIPELSSYSLKKLQEEEWITFEEVEAEVQELDLDFDPGSIKSLNQEQEVAFQIIEESLNKGIFSSFLLYGITGSGKTEVYIHALKKALDNGKGGIVLVPEIALTPQTVARFYRIFGNKVAVLHSRMTNRERLHAWKALKDGTKQIAIGPRSAVFAPVQNLGIIILDEEHDASYKQMDPAPRYHARETAIMRASISNAVVIMGSATPSMQALRMANRGKCVLLELNKRHANAILPEVKTLDLKEYKSAKKGELAVPLFMAIEEALNKKEQVILLYNRRGFASYLQCETCGHIPQSPECSVSLTYHKRKNMLMCHYSGYSRRADTVCESCGSNGLTVQGLGTQKIEEELEEFFPDARILRFDKDSTSRKGAHAKILKQFEEGEADILIGTQLVAKGLDFPNVTVVGVIDADTEQAFPSFQSTEKMYQLLSQVSGRSGRGKKPGIVIIQTRQPENTAIQYAKMHDHKGFSKDEMGFREELSYPPFSRLITFVLKGKKEQQVSQAAHILKGVVNKVVPDFDVLGPSASAVSWMNRNFFWEVTLKIDPEKGAKFIEALLKKVTDIYNLESPISTAVVRININVDAIR